MHIFLHAWRLAQGCKNTFLLGAQPSGFTIYTEAGKFTVKGFAFSMVCNGRDVMQNSSCGWEEKSGEGATRGRKLVGIPKTWIQFTNHGLQGAGLVSAITLWVATIFFLQRSFAFKLYDAKKTKMWCFVYHWPLVLEFLVLEFLLHTTQLL